MAKKKVEVVVDDEIIDNPEEVIIEEVTEKKSENPAIVETGTVVNGKREFKNILTGTSFIED